MAVRMCSVCRQHKPQQDLLRFMCDQKKVFITVRKISGRSVYLCNDNSCKDQLYRRKVIERSFGYEFVDKNVDFFKEIR